MNEEGTYDQQLVKTVSIAMPVARVWEALTVPALMQQWMAETEIEVLTDWEVGGPFAIRGPWYKTHFENRGVVVVFEPMKRLSYTHLSSLSRLPDVPDSYTTFDFVLVPNGEGTDLTLTLSGFAAETIYRHLNFYWMVTLHVLKRYLEEGGRSNG